MSEAFTEQPKGAAAQYWSVVNELRDELLARAEGGLEPTVFYRASSPRRPYHSREQRGSGWVCRITSLDSPRHRATDQRPGACSEGYLFDVARLMYEGTWRPSTAAEVEEFHKRESEKRREMELENLKLSRKRALTVENLENAGALPQPLAPGAAGGSYSAVINGITVTVATFAELQSLLASQNAATTPAQPKAK